MKTNVSRMIVLGLVSLALVGPGIRLTAQAAGPDVVGQWGDLLDWVEDEQPCGPPEGIVNILACKEVVARSLEPGGVGQASWSPIIAQ